MVGATNKSIAAMSGAWLRKKVRHPWLGGPRRLTLYLATLDCATSNPSLSSSPWMVARPKADFQRSSANQHAELRFDLRSPSQWARLPTPVAAKAGPVPTHQRLGTDDREDLQDQRTPSIQLDKDQRSLFVSRTRPRSLSGGVCDARSCPPPRPIQGVRFFDLHYQRLGSF